jgi:hypothetical protein
MARMGLGPIERGGRSRSAPTRWPGRFGVPCRAVDLRAGSPGVQFSFDELGWELRTVVPGRREVLVLGRLVVVQPVLPAVTNLVHGIYRPDASVELASSTVSQIELGLAFFRWHPLPLFLPRPYVGMHRAVRVAFERMNELRTADQTGVVSRQDTVGEFSPGGCRRFLPRE